MPRGHPTAARLQGRDPISWWESQRRKNRRRREGSRNRPRCPGVRPAFGEGQEVPELGGRRGAPGGRWVPPRRFPAAAALEKGGAGRKMSCRGRRVPSWPWRRFRAQASSRQDLGLLSCGRSALVVSERRGRARAGPGPGGTIRCSASRAAAPAAGPGPASRAAAPAAAPACYTGDTPSAPPAT